MNILIDKFKNLSLQLRNYLILGKVKKLGLSTKLATINEDGSVNYTGKVVISNMELREIPVKFGTVEGDFICSDNFLKSLKNAPHTVNGDFYCSRNCLTSLKFGPSIVTDSYLCRQNKITELDGSPKIISGLFDCSENELKNLKNCPEFIGGELIADSNFINTLEYFPKYTGDDIKLQQNDLKDIDTLKRCEIKGWLFIGEESVNTWPERITTYTSEELEIKFKKDEILALKENLDSSLKEATPKPTRKIKI